MNKNAIRGCIVLAILAVVFSVVVFALPFEKNGVFVVSYVFALVAGVAQVYVFNTAFRGEGTVKSKFYGMPIAHIGLVYLVAQGVLSLIFMALASLVPLWLVVIVDVVLLGVMAVGFIAADTMRDEVVRQDSALKADVTCMRTLQSKAAAVAGQLPGGPARDAAEKFAEKLRFSDPVSSAALREVEAELTACVDEIQRAATDGDRESVTTLLAQADTLLLERNRLCKLSKSDKS